MIDQQPDEMSVHDKDEVSLLRSLADEMSGRDAGQLHRLAGRIERGESASIDELLKDRQVIASPWIVSAYLAVANRGSGFSEVSLNATRYEIARSIRRKLILCVVVGLAYLIASLLVGVSLFRALSPFAGELYNWNWWRPREVIGDWPMPIVESAYMASTLLTLLATVFFVWRVAFSAPCWVERIWDIVPLVGSTLRSLDLAEMSHSIYQCVSMNQSYAEALELTANRTRSSRLKKWMLSSASDLRRGENVQQAFSRLPIRGEWLTGWTAGVELNSSGPQTREVWALAAERMFSVATFRIERACQVIPTSLMVMSAAIASVALAVSFNNIIETLRSTTWF